MMLGGQSITNFPGDEKGFANAAYWMDYPTSDLVDIMTKGKVGTIWPQGFLNQVVYGCFWRDGVKCESPGGYNYTSGLQAMEVIDMISRVTKLRPELYDPDEYPTFGLSRRFLTHGLSMIKHTALPTLGYVVGDGGSFPTYNESADTAKEYYLGDGNVKMFEWLYDEFKEQRFAWALEHSGQVAYQGLSPDIDNNWRMKPELLNGIGVGILRDGRGSSSANHKGVRSVYVHYGTGGGHMGDTRMALHMFGHGQRIINQWGYPTGWNNWYWSHWTQNAGRQYSDGAIAIDHKNKTLGHNALLAGTETLQVMDNHLDYFDYKHSTPSSDTGMPSFTNRSDFAQKRMTLMINTDGKTGDEFYVLDWYRMLGGEQHVRPLNTLDGRLETTGLNLTPTSGQVDEHYPDFVRLFDGVQSDDTKPWTATWLIANKNQQQTDLRVRMHGISGANQVLLAKAVEPNNNSASVRNYVVTQNDVGEQDWSQTLSAIETYKESVTGATIAKITPLAVTDTSSASEYEAQGVEIILNSGRKDYLIISDTSDGDKKINVNGEVLTLNGQIAYLSLNSDNSVRELTAIAADSVSYGNYVARQSNTTNGQWEASIESIDPINWTITLDKDYENPAELIGRYINVSQGERIISLEISEAENNGGQLSITVLSSPIIQKLSPRHYEPRWLRVRDDFLNTSGVLNSFQAYRGAVIVGLSGKQYQVDGITEAGIRLTKDYDVQELEDDFPKGEVIDVYDYGEGFKLNISNILKASN
jgi:hypothetical protein